MLLLTKHIQNFAEVSPLVVQLEDKRKQITLAETVAKVTQSDEGNIGDKQSKRSNRYKINKTIWEQKHKGNERWNEVRSQSENKNMSLE
ncbi:hypothetical protein QE152_g29383 [Popillia japonica]|uniref:Uncharacterized protein n=1 Tax=Popillia japonica TaxID=7064 RepID=A0AAW1JHZ5_POPJA